MTKEEKVRFIKTLSQSNLDHMLSKIDRIPEEWGGWELRQYFADSAQEAVWPEFRDKKKERKYKNDVLVNML